MFEACWKSKWVLHAFVVMRNHYHLIVETPDANLVNGMHWLQATFATRFNRLRKESGHLFQGRYKALVIEPGDAMGQICHYVHLNPVRAGIVPTERLSEYRHSSYWFLMKPKLRPPFLVMDAALLSAGQLADTPAGRRCYTSYLAWQATEGPAGRNEAYVQMSADGRSGPRSSARRCCRTTR